MSPAIRKLEDAEDAAIAAILAYEPRPSRRGPRPVSLPPRAGVYFFQLVAAEKPIKIGVARNMRQRLGALQTGLPWKLVPVAFILGADARTESDLHAQFADYRMSGEWFRPGHRLSAFVDELRKSLR